MFITEVRTLLREKFSYSCSEILLWYIIGDVKIYISNYMKRVYEDIFNDTRKNIKLIVNYKDNPNEYCKRKLDDDMIRIISILIPPEITIDRWILKSTIDTNTTNVVKIISANCNTKIPYFYWLTYKTVELIEELLPVKCKWNIVQNTFENSYIKFLEFNYSHVKRLPIEIIK